MSTTAIEADVSICDRLARLRRELMADPDIMDQFEQRPEPFMSSLNDSNDLQRRIKNAVIDSPKGVRFLTLDHCLILARISVGDNTADPDAPIPYIGANVIAIYNAFVIGNAVAYHQAAASLGAVANAVALWNAKYTGAIDTPLPSASEQRPKPSSLHLTDTYLSHGMHNMLVELGLGESREKMLLRSALSKSNSKNNAGEIVVSCSYRGVDIEFQAVVDELTNDITIVDGTVAHKGLGE